MHDTQHYDVIVVGGGHAGTEAALAAARMGRNTLLLTHNLDTLGQLSCNPSIGGIGKGHLVREIDALGGIMALAADLSGIHFRTLNASKGPAVWATRAQVDRVRYKMVIRSTLENQTMLDLFQASVDALLIHGEAVTGVLTQLGLSFYAPAVVLTTGTFLGGTIHVGQAQHSGGRAGDRAATTLACQLREFGLPVGRLKTGTPPRLDGRSIDFSLLDEQAPDDPAPVFSTRATEAMHPRSVSCWMARTNAETHRIIRSGREHSPLFTGQIKGLGPRYCPSIEDKVERFADKDSHPIFLEPEGLDTTEIYPNGISTSLPFDLQYAAVRSIVGLKTAKILRCGYAIEYDYFDPRGLKRSLETRALQGLFFAGQINGTTGYEEAAAQGLLAGVNAARFVRGEAAYVPARHQAYLGVLIDDLTTRGVSEPYRMFTSRAEFRLQLREDNAELRLTEVGRELRLVSDAQWDAFRRRRDAIETELYRLHHTWVTPERLCDTEAQLLLGQAIEHEYSLAELLRRPHISYQDLMALPGAGTGVNEASVAKQVEIQIKYQGYVERQQKEVEQHQHLEHTALPSRFDYAALSGLSKEVQETLNRHQPETLGQASRISGVTPAAIALLSVYVKKYACGKAPRC